MDARRRSWPTRGRGVVVRVLPNGCVVALADGAQHVVVWPDGSEADDDGDGASVRLPGGTVLEADSTSGDTFGAVGVIDDARLTAIDDDPATSDGYLGSYLGFCDVDGPPLVIRDAGTVVVD